VSRTEAREAITHAHHDECARVVVSLAQFQDIEDVVTVHAAEHAHHHRRARNRRGPHLPADHYPGGAQHQGTPAPQGQD
jgi:hypothetical protein